MSPSYLSIADSKEPQANNLLYVHGYIDADTPTPEQEVAKWGAYVNQNTHFKEDVIEKLAEDLKSSPRFPCLSAWR